MALISLPQILAHSFQLDLLGADIPLESFAGNAVIYSPPYDVWYAVIELHRLSQVNARPWLAVLAQLKYLENTCKVTPPGYPGPGTGYSGANPLVVGAGQTGSSLNADGVPVSTAIALTGDHIECNSQYHRLTADATSDGFGNVTFQFEPPMRAAPSDNASIELQTPGIIMRRAKPIASTRYTKIWYEIPPIELIEDF